MDPTPGNKETEKVTIPVLPPPFLTHRTSSQLLSKTGNILTVPMMTARANTYYFLRLGEVYYIHAEAEARQGGNHLAAARTMSA